MNIFPQWNVDSSAAMGKKLSKRQKWTNLAIFLINYLIILGRRSGLMVSVLASGLSISGSSADQGHCVVFFRRHITLAVPLSTQVYKWVPADLMLGTTLR